MHTQEVLEGEGDCERVTVGEVLYEGVSVRVSVGVEERLVDTDMDGVMDIVGVGDAVMDMEPVSVAVVDMECVGDGVSEMDSVLEIEMETVGVQELESLAVWLADVDSVLDGESEMDTDSVSDTLTLRESLKDTVGEVE